MSAPDLDATVWLALEYLSEDLDAIKREAVPDPDGLHQTAWVASEGASHAPPGECATQAPADGRDGESTAPAGEAAVFWSRVQRGSATECWPWLGSLDREDYGWFKRRGTRRRAHRVAYELAVGPIPEGLVLDHLCRNPRCVNPGHLEPVTVRENIIRGTSPSARAARVTHCPKGHPYDEANTRHDRGVRRCKTCRAVVARKYYEKRRGTGLLLVFTCLVSGLVLGLVLLTTMVVAWLLWGPR